MKYGIIANLTATNGQPSFRGYDLLQKDKPKDYVYYDINDYELIFNGYSVENDGTVSAQKLLTNLDRSIVKVYEDKVEIEKNCEELDKTTTEPAKMEINGTVIKSIFKENGKYRAELKGLEVEKARQVLQNMLDAWAGVRIAKIQVEFNVINNLRKGTLDVAKVNDSEYLVEHTADGVVPVTSEAVRAKKVKESLYFMLQPFRYSEELFLNHINCEYEVNGYVALYEKGKLYFEKKEGNFTELEIAIAKDLIKLKV